MKNDIGSKSTTKPTSIADITFTEKLNNIKFNAKLSLFILKIELDINKMALVKIRNKIDIPIIKPDSSKVEKIALSPGFPNSRRKSCCISRPPGCWS